MNNLDNAYFELYKDTDNIVKDAYKNENGLKYYIDFMDSLDESDYQKCCRVPNWKLRRKSIKHLCRIRNQISHETGSDFATENDYNGLMAFRDELLNGNDPLAEYRSYNTNDFNINNANYYESYENNKPEKMNLGAWWLVPIFIVAAFCIMAIVSMIN